MLLYIQPGKLTQNAFIESFNSRVRDEFLNPNRFRIIFEAKRAADEWRHVYNTIHPHSSLENQTPEDYLALYEITQPPHNRWPHDGTYPTGLHNAGVTYDFFERVFGRQSIDGKDMRLLSSVNYSKHYDNAFWDGKQMVYGDGDGVVFGGFTGSIDVIAHELTHGVTQMTCGLPYHGESGALNESISDVFGSMVMQRYRKADGRHG